MKKLALMLFLLPLSAFASQQLRPLLMEAIDAPDGKATSVIHGDEATKLQAALKTTAAVHAHVTTVSRYRQQGCRRLEVKLTIPGELFKTTDGRMMPFETGFKMNLCRDGTAPKSLEIEQ